MCNLFAIPYLRDFQTLERRWKAKPIRIELNRNAGMKAYFDTVVNYASQNMEHIPVILMGHLFTSGVTLLIVKGHSTLGGFWKCFRSTNDFFHKTCKYIALGPYSQAPKSW